MQLTQGEKMVWAAAWVSYMMNTRGGDHDRLLAARYARGAVYDMRGLGLSLASRMRVDKVDSDEFQMLREMLDIKETSPSERLLSMLEK